MSKHEDKLAQFLREVSNWSWEEFVRAEKDPEYTSNEAVIFALVRACAMQKMDAIKVATNRLDGKLKTPIRIEYPKVYYLFPNAGLPPGENYTEPQISIQEPAETIHEAVTGEIMAAPDPQPDEPEPDLPSMGFRETLALMSDYPRELPEQIIEMAIQTQMAVNEQAQMPHPNDVPRVKAVVAAHLLVMAQKRNMDAVGEVFDAIDGKLVETIQVLGDDLFITDYSSVAPEGATRNENGILQIEAKQVQDMWAQKLGRDQ